MFQTSAIIYSNLYVTHDYLYTLVMIYNYVTRTVFVVWSMIIAVNIIRYLNSNPKLAIDPKIALVNIKTRLPT